MSSSSSQAFRDAFGPGASVRRDPGASRKWSGAYEKTSKVGPHHTMFLVKREPKSSLAAVSAAPKSEYTRTGSYLGAWEGNKRSGVGVQVYAKDGSRYEGSWANDQREGEGSLFVERKAAGGAKLQVLSYKGEWCGGVRHGRGKQFYANGDVYDGDWEYGVRAGRGSMIYADGTRYAGSWVADQRSGRGVLVAPKGDAYDGQWEEDEKHGPGRYIYAERRMVLVGEWLRGAPCAGEMTPIDDEMALMSGDTLLASTVTDIPALPHTSTFPELDLADPRGVVLAGATAAKISGPQAEAEAALASRGIMGTRGSVQTGFTAEFGAPGTNSSRPSTSMGPESEKPSTAEAGVGGISPSVLRQIYDAFAAADPEGTGLIPADPAAIEFALAGVRLKPEAEDLERITEWLRAEQADVDAASGTVAGGISLDAFAAVLVSLIE